MKQILCVLLNNWPIDRVRRRRSRSAPEPNAHGSRSAGLAPLIIVRTAANRQEVVAVSHEARPFGIRVGMTLAQSRALCAHVTHLEHDPRRDAVALEALARWMMRFTPVVCVPSLLEGQPHGVLLDLTGCGRVFGGMGNILQQVSDALKHFRLHARLAIAPTPGAAWAVAFASQSNGRIIAQDEIAAALEDLPPVALRLPAEMVVALHHLGIDTIGRLMRMPRSSLPARFGGELLMRLDQALGQIAEPLVPLEPFSPIEARMDFDGAVDSLEAIWLVFKRLIAVVVKDLLRRGHGARELSVEFYRPYAITLHKTIRLSVPSRDPANLFNLLRCAMETLQTDVGFLGIKLIVSRSQRVRDEQIGLLENEQFISATELTRLIERLCIRLGDEVIAQPALVESHVPERAFACRGLPARDGEAPAGTLVQDVVRPLHLLRRPEEIRVIVSPSEDREGCPISFTWKYQTHRLLHTVGPERIAGEWWEGHHKTRDYFDAEDEAGRRFWIFRVMETGKWYVQGEFE